MIITYPVSIVPSRFSMVDDAEGGLGGLFEFLAPSLLGSSHHLGVGLSETLTDTLRVLQEFVGALLYATILFDLKRGCFC